MKLIVDAASRYAKQRAHTATHLLHAALNTIFPETKQAGSLVDEDYVRFDFQSERMLSEEELRQIEETVNGQIYDALEVSISEMSFDEAKKLAAKAFFEDKYGDRVRVVRVSGPSAQDTYVSVELCGGTHVARTDAIGAFAIVSQEAVASGTKRLTALTGRKVAELAATRLAEISSYAQTLGVAAKQLDAKIAKVLKEHEEMSAQIESLQSNVLRSELQKVLPTQGFLNLDQGGILESAALKTVAQYAAEVVQGTVVLYKQDGAFAVVSSEDKAKEKAQELGLQG